MASSTSSRASSPSSSLLVLPAKRSVQALLDELSDSDSDSDVNLRSNNASSKPFRLQADVDREQENSDEDVLVGGGRLAARLAGDIPSNNVSKFAQSLRDQSPGFPDAETTNEQSRTSPAGEQPGRESEGFKPTRRLLLKRKRVIDDDEDRGSTQRRIQALSPQSSPVSRRSVNPAVPTQADSPNRNGNDGIAGKSKFAILVEKARKERLAREEAERAKAARRAQDSTSNPKRRGPRGSSPADGSEEESDRSETAPARRLTAEARPTRKASKKALEEMNRETQRMNRNMQLAHQARTRKKFTKESFLANFGHTLPFAVEAAEAPHASSSSTPSSDAESAKQNSTPPTSPLLEPDGEKMTAAPGPIGSTTVPIIVEDSLDDIPDLMEIIASRRAEEAKSTRAAKQQRTEVDETDATVPIRVASMLGAQLQPDSDSGSDIEVVFEKGLKRKYVAFENLPKRKTKETPSHLALRSLANIKHQKDKKSSMSAADMGPVLLKAARRQAQEERQAKVEKLRAAGVTIQTAEEREQDQEELEDLVERARQEDEEIRKREKELAKREGTYAKDALDDDDSDEEDGDFGDDNPDEVNSEADDEDEDGDAEDAEDAEGDENCLIDAAAEESAEEAATEDESIPGLESHDVEEHPTAKTPIPSRVARNTRIIVDDEDDEGDIPPAVQSPALPSARKTSQSILRSARKIIPGLQHSDDLPIGLTQAFAATMADSQTQQEEATQEQDSMDILRDMPSPQIDIIPRLDRLESLDMISESVPGSQIQPLDLGLGLSQSQRVPESPTMPSQIGASQAPFELTQDAGYSFSPFTGNRFAETPRKGPHSTEETIILAHGDESPIVQRRSKLQRGRQAAGEEDGSGTVQLKSAFQLMNRAAKRKTAEGFSKKKSEARQAVDEAAEESDDEYAGLGGASDEDSGEEENEDDRQMIDEDTQVGKGDEAKLAKLHADRERQSDEQAVSKLLKDITTGALRRKRGAGDDLDLSDEEDATARRREAKRREFAKMRRELLKDEAVGKIADDKRKEAFLKSIEDREDQDDEDGDFEQPETPLDDSQSQSQKPTDEAAGDTAERHPSRGVSTTLRPIRDSQLNIVNYDTRRAKAAASRRPGTLAEIRESVSYLIEEPDSQAGTIDLGLSDSEDEPEAYVNLDRHIAQAEADENAMDDENEDLGDFVVDDGDEDTAMPDTTFKKPELPSRERYGEPFAERRTKGINFVDRLSLLRQTSSAGTNASSKMAFYTAKSATGSLNNAPALLRRATTNSSLGSISGRETVSATGVVTSKTERGGAAQEKEFVRKGLNSSRNAINYQGRRNLKEEKMSARAGVVKKKKQGDGLLSGMLRGDTWA